MPTRTYDTTPTDQEIAEARQALLARPVDQRMAFLAGYLGGTLKQLDGKITDDLIARSVARARALDLAYGQLLIGQVTR